MINTGCIIIHPQRFNSKFLYNGFVNYFTNMYDSVFLIVVNDPMYLNLYRLQTKVSLVPINNEMEFNTSTIQTYISDIQEYRSREGLSDCKVFGYEEFDELRLDTNSYYNLHRTLYFDSLFTFEEISSTYPDDFTDKGLLISVEQSTVIDRNLNTETFFVSKIQRIAAVPYVVTTSDAYKEYVFSKELTSMNVHKLFPNLRNYFNLIYFIKKAVFVVVDNSALAAMIYYLQTHKSETTGEYIIDPITRVHFDLDGGHIEHFPQFLNPQLSSWTFLNINGHIENQNIEPQHFISIEVYASLLKIDVAVEGTVTASNQNIELVKDSENGYRYEIIYNDLSLTSLTIVEDGISTEFAGLQYPLPTYDLTLGKDHVNMSLYFVFKPKCEFTGTKILFSYGVPLNDFTMYITEPDEFSQSGSLGIAMFNGSNLSIEDEFPKTNVVEYTREHTYICYASLSRFNHKLTTQLTLYDMADIALAESNNTYFEYPEYNLPYREGGVELGNENDSVFWYFELVRGVLPDDEKNRKIASLLDTWSVHLGGASNYTHPDDVDVDVYDEYGVSIEPVVEMYNSHVSTTPPTERMFYVDNATITQTSVMKHDLVFDFHMKYSEFYSATNTVESAKIHIWYSDDKMQLYDTYSNNTMMNAETLVNNPYDIPLGFKKGIEMEFSELSTEINDILEITYTFSVTHDSDTVINESDFCVQLYDVVMRNKALPIVIDATEARPSANTIYQDKSIFHFDMNHTKADLFYETGSDSILKSIRNIEGDFDYYQLNSSPDISVLLNGNLAFGGDEGAITKDHGSLIERFGAWNPTTPDLQYYMVALWRNKNHPSQNNANICSFGSSSSIMQYFGGQTISLYNTRNKLHNGINNDNTKSDTEMISHNVYNSNLYIAVTSVHRFGTGTTADDAIVKLKSWQVDETNSTLIDHTEKYIDYVQNNYSFGTLFDSRIFIGSTMDNPSDIPSGFEVGMAKMIKVNTFTGENGTTEEDMNIIAQNVLHEWSVERPINTNIKEYTTHLNIHPFNTLNYMETVEINSEFGKVIGMYAGTSGENKALEVSIIDGPAFISVPFYSLVLNKSDGSIPQYDAKYRSSMEKHRIRMDCDYDFVNEGMNATCSCMFNVTTTFISNILFVGLESELFGIRFKAAYVSGMRYTLFPVVNGELIENKAVEVNLNTWYHVELDMKESDTPSELVIRMSVYQFASLTSEPTVLSDTIFTHTLSEPVTDAQEKVVVFNEIDNSLWYISFLKANFSTGKKYYKQADQLREDFLAFVRGYQDYQVSMITLFDARDPMLSSKFAVVNTPTETTINNIKAYDMTEGYFTKSIPSVIINPLNMHICVCVVFETLSDTTDLNLFVHGDSGSSNLSVSRRENTNTLNLVLNDHKESMGMFYNKLNWSKPGYAYLYSSVIQCSANECTITSELIGLNNAANENEVVRFQMDPYKTSPISGLANIGKNSRCKIGYVGYFDFVSDAHLTQLKQSLVEEWRLVT